MGTASAAVRQLLGLHLGRWHPGLKSSLEGRSSVHSITGMTDETEEKGTHNDENIENP